MTSNPWRLALGTTADVQTVTTQNNVYWNGGLAIPDDALDVTGPMRDTSPLLIDPEIVAGMGTRPTWRASTATFADGSTTICEAFRATAERFGRLPRASPARGAAMTAIAEDVLGRPRPAVTSVGAFEP